MYPSTLHIMERIPYLMGFIVVMTFYGVQHFKNMTFPLNMASMTIDGFIFATLFDNIRLRLNDKLTYRSTPPEVMRARNIYQLNYVMDTILITIMAIAGVMSIASLFFRLQDLFALDVGTVKFYVFIEFLRIIIRIIMYRFLHVDAMHLPKIYQWFRTFALLGFIFWIEVFFNNVWEIFQLVHSGFDINSYISKWGVGQHHGSLFQLIHNPFNMTSDFQLPDSLGVGVYMMLAHFISMGIDTVAIIEDNSGKSMWYRVKSLFYYVTSFRTLIQLLDIFLISLMKVNYDQIIQNYNLPPTTSQWVVYSIVLGHFPSVFIPVILVHYFFLRLLKLRSPFTFVKNVAGSYKGPTHTA